MYEAMKATKKIIMATYGEAKVFKGSLGFVITDLKNKVLLLCYGQAAGHDPLSFQTKTTVFLAALQVLFLIAEYYKEGPNKSIATNKLITFFTDSLSMVKKLTAMKKYLTDHLRCAMDPEWDLLQVIHRLMTKMKERLELEWVCNHQDDNPEVDITKLSVVTQLNINTDTLVTQGLDRLESNPRVLIDPTSEVLLHQRG